jgi:ABC-type lipoprotein release transport system permease subunit
VSILGVGLGVASLLVVQTVMNGFGEEHRLRIRESFGDCQVTGAATLEQPEALAKQLTARPEVASAALYAEGPALARQGDFSGIAQVRGIDPTDPNQPARRYVHFGRFDDLDDGRIILGVGLARALRVRIGDRIEVWSPAMAERAEKGKAPLPAEFEVTAVIQTGFAEVDNAAALHPAASFPRAVEPRTARPRPDAAPQGADGRRRDRGPSLRGPSRPALPSVAGRREGLPRGDPLREDDALLPDVHHHARRFVLHRQHALLGRHPPLARGRRARRDRRRPLAGRRALRPCGLLIGALGTSLGFVLTWTILACRDGILSAINACFGDGDMVANIYQFSKVPLHYDAADFVIAAAFTLLTTAVAGLVPALWAAGRKPSEAMRDA